MVKSSSCPENSPKITKASYLRTKNDFHRERGRDERLLGLLLGDILFFNTTANCQCDVEGQ